ncbi:MAG: hypothetical protein J6W69_00110 [Bacteroidales bacterium]|nr:hypothetical protein [Bacteroidales bacterium]
MKHTRWILANGVAARGGNGLLGCGRWALAIKTDTNRRPMRPGLPSERDVYGP